MTTIDFAAQEGHLRLRHPSLPREQRASGRPQGRRGRHDRRPSKALTGHAAHHRPLTGYATVPNITRGAFAATSGLTFCQAA